MDNIDPILEVSIISPRRIIFEGKAYSVSSKNSAGKFDILPYHANFVSFIEKEVIKIHKADGQWQEFKFEFAIVYNNNNQVKIYTEISHPISILKL